MKIVCNSVLSSLLHIFGSFIPFYHSCCFFLFYCYCSCYCSCSCYQYRTSREDGGSELVPESVTSVTAQIELSGRSRTCSRGTELLP